MNKYPVIENGEIINVIMWDGISPLPQSLLSKIDTDPNTPKKIGAKKVNNSWVDPPTPIPTEEQEFEQMIEELREEFKNRKKSSTTEDIITNIN